MSRRERETGGSARAICSRPVPLRLPAQGAALDRPAPALHFNLKGPLPAPPWTFAHSRVIGVVVNR